VKEEQEDKGGGGGQGEAEEEERKSPEAMRNRVARRPACPPRHARAGLLRKTRGEREID
jgi:hypothetical protein